MYVITHRETGRAYVGKTHDPKLRWQQHRSKRGKRVSNAIHAYGDSAFAFDVLEWFTTEAEAYWWEAWWIEYLGTLHPRGFNLKRGGLNASRPTAVVREKIRIARARQVITPETRAKMSASHAGRAPARRAIEKAAALRRGVPRTPEERAKMSAAKRGTTQSRETIAKRTAARAGYRHSHETRDRMSASHKARWPSEKQACSIDGCNRPVKSNGLCNAHNAAAWKRRTLNDRRNAAVDVDLQ